MTKVWVEFTCRCGVDVLYDDEWPESSPFWFLCSFCTLEEHGGQMFLIDGDTKPEDVGLPKGELVPFPGGGKDGPGAGKTKK